MSSHPIYQLMQGDLSRVTETNHILARLWMLTLMELDVTEAAWDNLMTNYISKAKEELGTGAATNLKGNLPKGLAKDEITFKRFCQGISVFSFYKMDLALTLTKDGKTKRVSVTIPETFKSDAGKYLKTLWLAINEEFPDCVKNWQEYLSKYKDKYASAYGVNTDCLGSNISRSLDDEDLTWNTFFQGLHIHDFEDIRIDLDLYKKTRKTEAIVIGLDLVHTKRNKQ